jgi:hypothetical protein
MSVRCSAKKMWASAAMSTWVICDLLGVASPVTAQVQTAVEYGLRMDSGSYYSRRKGWKPVLSRRSSRRSPVWSVA